MRNQFLFAPYFILLTAVLFVFKIASAQEKKEIKILGANELKLVTLDGREAKMLKGEVQLQQGDALLECDIAYFFNDKNDLDAYGNVHITQAQTQIFADTLRYFSVDKRTSLTQNVKVLSQEITLFTSHLDYFTESQFAFYYSKATIISNFDTLTSQKGYLKSAESMAFFKEQVQLKSTDYILNTDTLQMNTQTKEIFFVAPTSIVSPSQTIFCEQGTFNPQLHQAHLGINTRLFKDNKILNTDSLNYNTHTQIGKTFSYFEWIDTASHLLLYGTQANFSESNNSILAINYPVLVHISDNDSLFITGDTLFSYTDTTTQLSTMIFYHDVSFFKPDLQGKCDSLYFSYADSVLKMFVQPVLWTQENQLSGDTIFVYMKNQKFDQFEMFENGFMISQLKQNYFNQVKGKKITGYFKENQLDFMHVVGNAESVYYIEDNIKALVGANWAVGSEINIYLKEKKVDKIVFYEKPEAMFYPIQKITPEEIQLDNFKWQTHFRPPNKNAIFLKSNTKQQHYNDF